MYQETNNTNTHIAWYFIRAIKQWNYNMKNIFLETSYTKCFGKTSSRLFSKILYSLFFNVCSSRDVAKYIETVMLNSYCYLKASPKNKKRSGTSLPSSFFSWFLNKKYFSHRILLTGQVHCLIVFIYWDIGQYVCWDYLFPNTWSHESWN